MNFDPPFPLHLVPGIERRGTEHLECRECGNNLPNDHEECPECGGEPVLYSW